MPSNVWVERKRILEAFGTKIIWTNPADGSDGAIRVALKLAAEQPQGALLELELRGELYQARGCTANDLTKV
jgi:cysteine synthase